MRVTLCHFLGGKDCEKRGRNDIANLEFQTCFWNDTWIKNSEVGNPNPQLWAEVS